MRRVMTLTPLPLTAWEPFPQPPAQPGDLPDSRPGRRAVVPDFVEPAALARKIGKGRRGQQRNVSIGVVAADRVERAERQNEFGEIAQLEHEDAVGRQGGHQEPPGMTGT